MAIERTFSILKPDALQSGVVGKILAKFEESGLKPVAMKMLHLTQQEAEGFYAVHRERPFFKSLVAYMTSGPVIVQVLEGENAVAENREVMGATNPANAAEGTIRKLFARSIEANSVHGSDSAENARAEIAYFFAQTELVRYEWKKQRGAGRGAVRLRQSRRPVRILRLWSQPGSGFSSSAASSHPPSSPARKRRTPR